MRQWGRLEGRRRRREFARTAAMSETMQKCSVYRLVRYCSPETKRREGGGMRVKCREWNTMSLFVRAFIYHTMDEEGEEVKRVRKGGSEWVTEGGESGRLEV